MRFSTDLVCIYSKQTSIQNLKKNNKTFVKYYINFDIVIFLSSLR